MCQLHSRNLLPNQPSSNILGLLLCVVANPRKKIGGVLNPSVRPHPQIGHKNRVSASGASGFVQKGPDQIAALPHRPRAYSHDKSVEKINSIMLNHEISFDH